MATIDCVGLKCPMPIVKIAAAMKQLPAGETLEVRSDDAAFPEDVRAWSRTTGNALVSLQEGETHTALIRAG